jgi:hypothetical protein
MVSTSRDDYDSDEDFVVIRRPLLVAQGAPSYLPTTADPRGVHPQLWSSSMRQKVTIQLLTVIRVPVSSFVANFYISTPAVTHESLPSSQLLHIPAAMILYINHNYLVHHYMSST